MLKRVCRLIGLRGNYILVLRPEPLKYLIDLRWEGNQEIVPFDIINLEVIIDYDCDGV
jgi:hypothetical protein